MIFSKVPKASNISNAQLRTGLLLVLLLGSLMLIGCPPSHPSLDTLVSVDKIVAEHNRNAAKIPQLWARADITFREKPGGFPLGADGILMLNKTPGVTGVHDFALIFKKSGEELGRVGISTRESAYYMWMKVDDNPSCVWGHLALAGAEGLENIRINPVQLLSVLTVCELPSVFSQVPFVGQTISLAPPAYVLTYVERQPVSGKLLFTRRIHCTWSVTQPPRPFKVELLDNRGVVVLTAKLSNYQPIATGNDSDNDPEIRKLLPVMPTDIRLKWKDGEKDGAELDLKLYKMTTTDTKIDSEDIPLAYSLRYHLKNNNITKIKCLDAHLMGRGQPKNGSTDSE
ncbi:MAG: hypothetical protein KAR11_00240 [Phycisphaerae bacterium]|nr:hypothetical protein [Phycisphaerae bacterium]